ncbi:MULTISPECIES: S41 family peptidase [unclassified Sphingobacterium]|uniref:S41 family peptidase n=1 Tax=unclassified Sphingobacterium TaxID=2609468 RepID=UPI00104E86D8|nr:MULTISPECIES: S41 family peptidase [unclassified Sphingobacterium]MCS3554700.1 C-terminal processing protease CtpA/Prc [Sphingobacterium sp. JUb21]TCR07688.1 C-terminal processing protease CtpA/Prc [Sphingobacterium sp. JUb20]
MKKIINLFGLIFFVSIISFAQNLRSSYNLEFNDIHMNVPKGWKVVEGKTDALHFETDKSRSQFPVLKVSSNVDTREETNVLQMEIPDNLLGKELSLEADIRTQDMGENGSVGFFLSIQPKVGHENIREDYKGSNEWTRHIISVKMSPKETKKIILGLYLLGKGTAWFGNLKLKVDGEDYSKSKIYHPQIASDSIYVFNSHVSPFDITAQRLDRLKTTAQIWGLIKYFHPAVAEGKWDMDTELFKFLPVVLEDQTEVQFDHNLQKWISGFGNYSTSVKPARIKNDNVKMEADFNWINRLRYSKKLKDKLYDLTLAIRSEVHQNISFFEGPNNPDINEYKYATVSINDVGFRLLSLFRYWNIIQYYNPYRYLLADWDNQLNTFIPLFVNSNSAADLDQTYLRLFASIKDSHAFGNLSTNYHSSVFGDRTVGFKIKMIENKAVVTSLGADSLSFDRTIQIGDIITRVNGRSVSDIITSIKPFIAASNEAVKLRDATPRMLQTRDNNLDLNVSRNGDDLQLIVPTRAITDITPFIDQDTSSYRIIDKHIGYLNVGKFKENQVSAFWNDAKNTRGLIFDFRHYPQSAIHRDFSKYLFPSEREFVKFVINKGFTPGEFRFEGSSTVGEANPNCYKGKIILLINEDTQSAGEFQTMAFQTIPGAVVMGSVTSGADGNISWIPLPFGYRTAFSGLGIYYADGRETQGVGISPDIEVKPTIEGIKVGKDELLIQAIAYIED